MRIRSHLNRVQLTVGIVMILAVGSAASQTNPDRQVRTDGVYYAVVGGSAAEPTYQYFRFYGDGTALTVDSSGKPLQVARWFNKSAESVQEGKWTLQGDSLVLKIGTEFRYTLYQGTLTADAWTMDSSQTKFAFTKVVFAPEKARVGPKIESYAKSTTQFSYDSTGNVVSATTTLEVAATDPDGGALTFVCSTTSGTVETRGSKCIWSRPIDMGQPGHGVVTVVVTNSKGVKALRSFTF